MSIANILDDLKPSEIRRMFDLASTRKDSISLGIGEPDFPTPSNIKEAAKNAMDQDATHYAPNGGIPELREAIAEKSKKENDVECAASNVLVTVGATEGIFLALASMIGDGDEVIIPAPNFLNYAPCVRLAGGIPREVACAEENNFHLSAKDLERSIADKTKAIILASPNNPTGATLTMDEMEEIAQVAVKNNLQIIADEVYERFVYDGKRSFSIASIAWDNTTILNSFSKTYAMTGWRIGYIVSKDISKMLKLHMNFVACVSTFSQYGALAALKGGYEEVDKMIAEYAKRREFVYDRLSSMKHIRVQKPEGAFYFFPSVKDTGMSSKEFCERVFEETGVVVVNGGAFGECGNGYVRISYATSMEKLKEAMDRMESFLEKL
jgi:aspartate/methionine/tyrosine aminotransferase